MRYVKVYHLNNDSDHWRKIMFDGEPKAVTKVFEVGTDYRLVAEVASDEIGKIEKHLERAFHDTNHIDRSWTENMNVDVNDHNPRSTSVGDVMSIDTAGGTMYFVVSGIGFTRIYPTV